jgi:hypothetical protein
MLGALFRIHFPLTAGGMVAPPQARLAPRAPDVPAFSKERLTSRNGKNRTLGNENGSEGPKFSAFHPPVLPPNVIAGEVDVFPAEGRQVLGVGEQRSRKVA